MTDTFDPSEAISFGWATTKRNLPLFVGVALLQLLLSSLEGGFGRMPHGSGGLLRIVAQLVGVALAMGWWRIALRAHDGRPVSFATLTEVTLPQYLQYLVATILVGVAIGLGLVLLVVPGIVAAARFAFAPALVVDQNVDALTAMRRSAELTRGHTVEVLVFGLFVLGLNLLGLLALGLGLLVTIPISAVAAAYVYRRLLASEVHGVPHRDVSSTAQVSS